STNMKLENKNCAPSGLVFANLNKIFWPKEKYTRGDVVEYHRKIAPVMLPYLKDRPESVNRHPDGATAHYWARELRKLGHEIRLMPAKDVKAYVKRNKNDAADAEAICEAVRRPTMRFVAVKSAEQQGRLMQHRVRDLLMRQRTQLINAMRAHLAELGIAAAQGREGLKELLAIVAQD